MLELLNQGLDQVTFLTALMDACTAQQRHDDGRTIHWSRHLLACMARVTGARGLIGCRSVTFHPHFWWFSSPDDDESLGSVREWPADECILLLDAFPPGGTKRSNAASIRSPSSHLDTSYGRAGRSLNAGYALSGESEGTAVFSTS